MNRLLLMLAVVLSLSFCARAEGPDEQYVRIYQLIQEADRLNESGQTRAAAAKYVEVQGALTQFRGIYPGWNERVINYRLNYVATKLARFVNNGSTTGAVNVPQVDLPEQDDIGMTEDAGGSGGTTRSKHRHHRILHFHRNVPGVMSKINSVMAELGVNIVGQYLKTNDEVGYVVLDVAPVNAELISDKLRSIPETIRVRMLW